MRLFAAIAIMVLLSPLAGECCVHGVEVSTAEAPALPELHAATDCDCGDEHHGEHEDCDCLCQLPAAPPQDQDVAVAPSPTGKIHESPCAAARHLSVPQDRPPIFA